MSGGQAAESRERGAATRNPSAGRGPRFCMGLRSGQLSGQMEFQNECATSDHGSGRSLPIFKHPELLTWRAVPR